MHLAKNILNNVSELGDLLLLQCLRAWLILHNSHHEVEDLLRVAILSVARCKFLDGVEILLWLEWIIKDAGIQIDEAKDDLQQTLGINLILELWLREQSVDHLLGVLDTLAWD